MAAAPRQLCSLQDDPQNSTAHVTAYQCTHALLAPVLRAPAATAALQASLIVSESAGKVMEAQGELITTQYFDSLAAEIDDLLQVCRSS